MKLIHYATYNAIDKIKKEGFKADIKRADTKKINICLESLKPKSIPKIVDLDNCIYFMPPNSIHTPFKVGGNIDLLGCLEVDTKDLDIKKLYVANGMYAGRIGSILNKAFRSEDVELSLNSALNTQYYKDTVSKFWRSFKPYTLYRAMNKNTDDEIIEFLYFDDIDPKVIKEIDIDRSIFFNRK